MLPKLAKATSSLKDAKTNLAASLDSLSEAENSGVKGSLVMNEGMPLTTSSSVTRRVGKSLRSRNDGPSVSPTGFSKKHDNSTIRCVNNTSSSSDANLLLHL